MIEYNKYICLFQNCILCKGAQRTMLYDIQRNDYDFFPNEIYDILTRLSKKYTVKQLINRFPAPKDRSALVEYIQFLFAKEYIFFCEKKELKNFPPIEPIWEISSEISNAIIDIKKNSNHNFLKIFTELDEAGCEHIQIRSFDPMPVRNLKRLLPLLENTCISDVEILVAFNPSAKDPITYFSALLSYPRVSTLAVHGAPFKKTISVKTDQQFVFLKDPITDEHHCGKIGEKYFSLNLPHILEAMQKNTCLNKKISIDADGYIKNCPSLPDSYGHSSEISIQQVLKQGKVKKLWDIKKDQIEVCKDCEFRYICTDCRAYVQQRNNILSKPGKCNYNPYTNSWD